MRSCRAAFGPRRAFSVFELLVLLAVLALVVGLGLAAISRVNEASAKVKSSNNLKQIGIAIHNCASANNNKVPPAFGKFSGQEGSIFFHILPYIEQGNVYNAKAFDTPIKVFVAPADPTNGPDKALTSYASNYSLFGDKGGTMPAIFFTKGTSNTVMFMERYAARNGKWAGKDCTIDGAKGGIDFATMPPGKDGPSAHAFEPGICQVGLGDGSVRSFTKANKDATFKWACDAQTTTVAPADW